MLDAAAMNGPDAPRVLDAADVDLYVLGLAGEPFPSYGVPVFTWHRPDRCLVYYRWTDDDGERYYRFSEFRRRCGLVPRGSSVR